MWDSGIEVMGNVSTSNFVVEEVNGSPWVQFVVWAVNCVEGTLHEVVIFIGKVWDINVGVLEPSFFCRKDICEMTLSWPLKTKKKKFPCVFLT